MMIRQESVVTHNNNITNQHTNDDLDLLHHRHRSSTAIPEPVVSKRCFTSIQQRQFWTSQQEQQNQPPPLSSLSSSQPEQNRTVELCPSMDLILYCDSTTASSSSSSMALHIHRTLNWQRIASTTVTTDNIRNDNLENTDPLSKNYHTDSDSNSHHFDMDQDSRKFTNDNTDSSPVFQTKIGWSPDGRYIAVALQRTVQIYSVEGLLLQFSSSASSTKTSDQHHHNKNDPSALLYSNSHSLTVGDGIVVAEDEDTDIATAANSSSNNHGKVFAFSLPYNSRSKEQDDQTKTVKYPSTTHNNNESENSIASLSWVHLGSWCEHPLWPTLSNNDHDSDYLTYNDQQRIRHQYYSGMESHHRSKYVLPPSHYYSTTHHRHPSAATFHTNGNDGGSINEYSGTSDTNDTYASKSMSLLCALTISGHLSIYWHGRYPIVSQLLLLPPSNRPSSNRIYHPIVASPDLTHFITAIASSTITRPDNRNSTNYNIVINSFPALSQYRSSYEMIASFHGETQQHIDTIRNSITEVVATWKSAFKPLDLKLDGLQKLLINYGLLENTTKRVADDHDGTVDANAANKLSNSNTIRSLLIQYMLSGSTTQNGGATLSNAIDQFFTGVQMNDQLVQRMGVTLFNNLANIESTVRKLLVAPATALLYVMDQLYGLSVYRTDLFASSANSSADVYSTPSTACLQLLHTAQQLLVTVNMTLSSLIDARSRIRILVAWLRSTGAMIKARGTAANSVQRENAKKRRISETVVHQLSSYLQESSVRNEDRGTGKFIGLTETILNLHFADTLSGNSIQDENVTPTSNKHDTTLSFQSSSIPHALQLTSQLADVVFELPRSLLLQAMKQTFIQLPDEWSNHTDESTIQKFLALTTRLGQGGINPNNIPFGDKPPSGYFSPHVPPTPMKEESNSASSSVHVRQWLVAAQSQSNSIQLNAFPLTWTNTGDEEVFDCDDDSDDSDMLHGLHSKSKWSVTLHLPSECTVRDIAFYSDDGKSTLSSSSISYDNVVSAATSSGAGGQQEGRQSLGLLISRRQPDLNSVKERVELWLLPYDELIYAYEPLQSVVELNRIDESTTGKAICECYKGSESCVDENKSMYTVLPMPAVSQNEDDAIDLDSDSILYARTRKVFDAVDFTPSHRCCQFVLSGSRGIGAVIWNHDDGNATTTTSILEIFDVEEDEDDDDDEAEQMEDDAE